MVRETRLKLEQDNLLMAQEKIQGNRERQRSRLKTIEFEGNQERKRRHQTIETVTLRNMRK